MPKVRRSRRKVGRGKILSWIKSAGSKVNDFLKRTKILSTITGQLKGISPYVAAADVGLKAVGYGRRRVGGNLNGRGLKRSGCGRRGRGLTRSGMGRILM
jgi:hypothetical protein